MFSTLVQVAFGGALGASSRFLLGMGILRLVGPGFPIAILAINVLGSFLMGLAVVYFGRSGSALGPFVMMGLLGGFTTFSAFSLETVTLIEQGSWGGAVAYVGMSVVLSILGLMAGVTLARGLI